MNEESYTVTVGNDLTVVGSKNELIDMLKDDLENFTGEIKINKFKRG